ncbi:deoxyribose-phosphate aldolase [Corynebacterium spheniscorum]|uniref:Deoxyribose-phosphate aldolase n=1 Tax=Corynebacterium spheniscorum TaxID=185761 RepID=A0A1I2RGT1_9CORY|nr:deoxyribose-phosphate aldolase [Corynebacterium spheniscorum]KAA8722588.1 deoxyribose-phosphate aldolase [Corynebacterium spheniscorum]SFG36996.1 deoxyribose-phosphate aldolase [Corynebacterium spheniscorum]
MNIASFIDHTLLKPEATAEDVRALVEEAARLQTFSVCVSPSTLPVEVPEGLKVATVCGFPSGAHHSAIKAAEAADSAKRGADEVDMVINLAHACSNDFAAVEADIRAVREALPKNVLLKVILETAALSDEQITECCLAAERAGAEFVKTSTGFHPAGGASVHAVELMHKAVGGRLGIKASGGIRDFETAQKMIDAGASRLGCSASAAIIKGASK